MSPVRVVYILSRVATQIQHKELIRCSLKKKHSVAQRERKNFFRELFDHCLIWWVTASATCLRNPHVAQFTFHDLTHLYLTIQQLKCDFKSAPSEINIFPSKSSNRPLRNTFAGNSRQILILRIMQVGNGGSSTTLWSSNNLCSYNKLQSKIKNFSFKTFDFKTCKHEQLIHNKFTSLHNCHPCETFSDGSQLRRLFWFKLQISEFVNTNLIVLKAVNCA